MRWLCFRIGGQRWSVYVVSPKSKHLDGGKYYARCFFEKCRIYLSRDLEGDAFEDAFLHEFVHAWNRVCGVWDILENTVGTKEAGRADEAMVTCGTPILHLFLRDLGFRFPPKP